MKEDPFSHMLNELGDILSLIEKKGGKPLSDNLDPEIENQLAKLESLVKQFESQTDSILVKEGENLKGIYHKFDKTPEIYNENQKKILRRCRDLGVNAV